MKTKMLFLLMIQIVYTTIWAGTISGEISYTGSFTGTVFIAAFTDPSLNSDPNYIATYSEPGSFSLENVNDGTYYIIAIFSKTLDRIKITDPYGFWGTLDNLTPIIISDNNNVSEINITLVDGTIENPNPFAEYFADPIAVIQLPESTSAGISPFLFYDGTSILLYKHDYQEAPSAKIFAINPQTGVLQNTYYLSLESFPNKISWIDKLLYRDGVLWAKGGYGDPQGSGFIAGVFRTDILSSSSSYQMPFNSGFYDTHGFACDGTNFFISISDSSGVGGIVKFNPDLVNEVPANLFISLEKRSRYLSYGDNFLWIGSDKVNKYDPISGSFIESLYLPGSAAELYFDSKFWTYDENDNTIKVYSPITTGISSGKDNEFPVNFSLFQNYPNPFNPTTKIKYSVPDAGYVTVRVYNILGQLVNTLVSAEMNTGVHEVTWNGTNDFGSQVSAGVYIYRISAGKNIAVKKMILIK